jgi:hypothetical protein
LGDNYFKGEFPAVFLDMPWLQALYALPPALVPFRSSVPPLIAGVVCFTGICLPTFFAELCLRQLRACEA